MTITADVFNQAREKVGTVELPTRIFSAKWSPRAVHQVTVAYLANQRDTVAHTKGRGEVSGGGKKPWKQKHTGRARHGSSRSPLWRGGGVTHGPLTERDFSKKVNEGMKRAALRAILTKKWKDGEITVIDNLTPSAPKTKVLVLFLKTFLGKVTPSALLVSKKVTPLLRRAGGNLPKVEALSAADLHAYACLAHHHLFLEKDAVPTLARRLG